MSPLQKTREFPKALKTGSDLLRVLYGDGGKGHAVMFCDEGNECEWIDLRAPESLDKHVKRRKDSNLYISVCAQKQSEAFIEKQKELWKEAGRTGRPPGEPDFRYMRGFKRTVICVPGVWFELDYADGEAHKEKALPSRKEAEAFIESLPLSPTLIIASGHGFHLYWCFDKPLVTDTDEVRSAAASLVQRWQGMILDRASQYGWKLDSTHDLTRVLRIPFTLNHKSNPPKPVQVLRYEVESRYTIPQLQRWIPEKEATTPSLPASGDITVEMIREMLAAINTRPGYRDWFRITAAVLAAVHGDIDLAEMLLKEWRPEEEEGEYRAKLESGLDGSIGVGTLVYLAKQHGWKPRYEESPVAVIGSSAAGTRPALTVSGDGMPVDMRQVTSDVQHDYAQRGGQTLLKQGDTEKVIADFEAVITREVTSESGDRIYRVAGRTRTGRTFERDIPAADFEDERKLATILGAAAGASGTVRAGMRKHLPPAIKLLSSGWEESMRYDRTGWRGDTFLVPGREVKGAEIELPKDLPYRVQHDADLSKAREALRAALAAVDPSKTTVALAFLLTPSMSRYIRLLKKYVLFVKGRTGSWKTSLMQVLMCLFGPDFIREESLIKFGEGATKNALLRLAAHAHDMPLLWDNFKPNVGGGDPELISTTHSIVEGGEKARLNRNSELKERRDLRCWLACTGEDLPKTDAASLARMVILEFERPSTSRNPALDKAQLLSEHLSALGDAWLAWLESDEGRATAAKANELFNHFRGEYAEYLRKQRPDSANILRVASNLASNRLAYEVAMSCPAFADVLSEHWEDYQRGIKECADVMAGYTADSLEAYRFLAGLKSLIASRSVTLAKRLEPTDERVLNRIGWHDDNGFYIIVDLAIKHVEDLYRNRGGLGGMTADTILAQLDELGLIAHKSGGKRTRLMRVYEEAGDTETKLKRVLHLKRSALEENDAAEDDGQP